MRLGNGNPRDEPPVWTSPRLGPDYKNLPRLCTGTGKSTRVIDLQSTTRLAESWTLQIFDTRVDFPVPEQSRG